VGENKFMRANSITPRNSCLLFRRPPVPPPKQAAKGELTRSTAYSFSLVFALAVLTSAQSGHLVGLGALKQAPGKARLIACRRFSEAFEVIKKNSAALRVLQQVCSTHSAECWNRNCLAICTSCSVMPIAPMKQSPKKEGTRRRQTLRMSEVRSGLLNDSRGWAANACVSALGNEGLLSSQQQYAS
jgi:hypothetical protein